MRNVTMDNPLTTQEIYDELFNFKESLKQLAGDFGELANGIMLSLAKTGSGERSEYCEHAKNPSGDIWECDCFLDTYCEHQIYDRDPDGTLNIVKCGERSEE